MTACYEKKKTRSQTFIFVEFERSEKGLSMKGRSQTKKATKAEGFWGRSRESERERCS